MHDDEYDGRVAVPHQQDRPGPVIIGVVATIMVVILCAMVYGCIYGAVWLAG